MGNCQKCVKLVVVVVVVAVVLVAVVLGLCNLSFWQVIPTTLW